MRPKKGSLILEKNPEKYSKIRKKTLGNPEKYSKTGKILGKSVKLPVRPKRKKEENRSSLNFGKNGKILKIRKS